MYHPALVSHASLRDLFFGQKQNWFYSLSNVEECKTAGRSMKRAKSVGMVTVKRSQFERSNRRKTKHACRRALAHLSIAISLSLPSLRILVLHPHYIL